MNNTTAGIVFIASLIVALALAYKPLGDYMYRVVTPTRHARVERWIYRAIGLGQVEMVKDPRFGCYLFARTEEAVASMKRLRSGEAQHIAFRGEHNDG